ncbi:DUF6114 domain-containing protein [Streptomyces sulphureus]|uniref:DUF6114 domain-containing protein n=1 Tax=Streptomyces sulphureus TaxID=47758 RepID=UPI00037EACBB|nr:DUF6114 domain-containing protein [Streptomyces sulphureus]
MSDADTRQRLMTGFGRKRRSFRNWRGKRPFWGGLLTLLAGIPIMYIPYQNLTLGSLTIRMSTTAGAGSLIIGVLLVVLGLTMWFQPHSRVFAGVAAILLSLVSLVVSNVGAFLIGFLLGLIGGALGVSWAPGKPQPPEQPGTGESGEDPDATAAPRPAQAHGAEGASRAEQPQQGPDAEGPGSSTAVSGVAPAAGADAMGNGRHRAG